MLYSLTLSALIATSRAVQLTDETLARIGDDFDDSCNLNGKTNCHLVDAAADYTTSIITFQGAVNDGTSCVYTYIGDHNENNLNCLNSGNQNPSLSHFGIDIFCKDTANLVIVGGTSASFGTDGSTCTDNMLKFDEGFEKEDAAKTFTLRLTWDAWTPATACSTKTGWIQQKAGTAFDFEEIQVPDACTNQVVTPAPVTPVTPAPVTPVTPAPVTPVTPAPIPPSGSCEAQGAALDVSHVCVCVQGECPLPSDGAFCNGLTWVANKIGVQGATDTCGAGYTCCCNCPNCQQIPR